ncbi:MAG: SAF domain-containing protein [Clostridiales bacterium]|nr:SAF domain-containing protein [Clostridiales bacterium]
MKRAKQIIGILLIIFAVTALVYWETDGRNRVVTKSVLVASENIMEGQMITRQMLTTVNAMPETVIAGAFTPDEAHRVEGKEAAQDIAQNQQISGLSLREPSEVVTDQRSPYVIKPEWIDSRSSSLRRGDIIKIYNRDGSYYLGSFEVVFVKDVAEREVTDLFGDGGSYGSNVSDIRNRTHSSGVISHLEILTELEAYQRILRFIDDTQEQLLIVQKGS